MKETLIPMTMFQLFCASLAEKTGLYFIDSTKLEVCHNKRIYRNKVFKNIANRRKTSTGWFYGFKLHLIINEDNVLCNYTRKYFRQRC